MDEWTPAGRDDSVTSESDDGEERGTGGEKWNQSTIYLNAGQISVFNALDNAIFKYSKCICPLILYAIKSHQ